MDILDVRIDNFSRKEILEKVASFLHEKRLHQIATINPEFILAAQQDHAFRKILNRSDLCIADGVGVWFAFLRYGKVLKARLAGTDLMEEILMLASINNYRVLLVASTSGLSDWKEVKKNILCKHPNLQINGITMNDDNVLPDDSILENDILLCNFGAPKQEKLIHSLKNRKNNQIRLAMGVGGGFDFLTKKIQRAPKMFRQIGLEWLWRFLQEPRYRARRIFQAVIIFPIKIIFNTQKNI
jgi:N-acetylglucosaminyldiphosphoundecaprenol N-acetyl-beta-D-mannosaminyltransferase